MLLVWLSFSMQETFNQTLVLCLHNFNTSGFVNVTFVLCSFEVDHIIIKK